METTTNKTILQQTGPTLQLKRSLLPIDEYAARQGLSVGIVNECGRLGIVQIRKHKGKTFVVDVPLAPYLYTPETTDQPAQPADKAAQDHKISDLVQKIIPEDHKPDGSHLARTAKWAPNKRPLAATDAYETPHRHHESENQTLKAGTISALAEKMFRNTPQVTDKLPETINNGINRIENMTEPVQIAPPEPLRIIDEPAPAVDKSARTQTSPKTIQTPRLKTLKADDKVLEFINETVQAEEEPEPAQVDRENKIQVDLLTTQPGSKHDWQLAVFFLMVFLFMALLGSFWLYMDRKIQLNRLDRANASIQMMHKDSRQADQQAETFRSELADSRAELERIHKEVNNSRAQVKTTREELAEAKQKLENIRNLTTWLPELTKNP